MILPRDILFAFGGEIMDKYGVWARRTAPVQEKGAQPSIIRADEGWFIDQAGKLRKASANRIRGHYINGELHALTEGARTNLLHWSEKFHLSPWFRTRLSPVATDAIAAPDGNLTADKILDDATAANSHAVGQNVTKAASALEYAFAVFCKAAEYDRLRLQLGDGGGTNKARADFDLTAGTVTTIPVAGDFGAGVSDMIALADGWWLAWITATSNVATTIQPLTFLDNGSGVTYDGDGSSGLYLWGGQLEQAAFLGSYIPTVGSADTRDSDVLSYPHPFQPQEMTVYAKFIERGTALTSSGAIVHIGGAAASDLAFQIRQDAATGRYEVLYDNGPTTVQSTLTGPPLTFGDVVELRAVLDVDEDDNATVQIGQSINGGPEILSPVSAANALADAWQDQLIYIGSRGTSGQGFAAHRAIKVVRGIPSMDELRALAA